MKTDATPFMFKTNARFKKFAYRVLLIITLHWSIIAPAQPLIDMTIAVYGDDVKDLFTPDVESILDEESERPLLLDSVGYTETDLDNTPESKAALPSEEAVKPMPKKTREAVEDGMYEADISQGRIGVSKEVPLDNPSDNLFAITIDQLPEFGIDDKVYLHYELDGVQGQNAVSRSINGRAAFGGYMVKATKGWTTQKEELNGAWLREGVNEILFTTPQDVRHQYSIKNVRIEIKKGVQGEVTPLLVIQKDELKLMKNDKIYIKGFVKGLIRGDLNVLAGNSTLRVSGDEFEGVVSIKDIKSANNILTVKALDPSGLLGQELIYLEDHLIEADYLYAFDRKNYRTTVSAVTADQNESFGIAINTNGNAFAKANTTITKLRNIDIAPLESGMRNVTEKADAYRVISKTDVSTEVPFKLEMKFNPALIPNGYTARDVKTFYFNKKEKSWKILPKDSLDVSTNTLVSYLKMNARSEGGTDYINGVIQTPEASTTSSFMPTMMNDIKAVNPSAQMTIISPPTASQTGDANITYPIRIPSGRNGMQPSVGLQYSNEGGNGWLGMGWSMSMPSVSLDTRWGAPTFNSTLETELYNIAGEMLMYPDNHLPHRHKGNSPATYIPSTQKRSAFVTNGRKAFTPRKQGSFTRIERFGNGTTNYVWKITDTSGTISWYGGDASGLNENAIVRNDNNHIVHWALFMVEDVYGNNMKYSYTNEQYPTSTTDNLSEGTYFYCDRITYTGHNGSDGNYEVKFNLTNTVKVDASINGKLGLKWVDPYLLNNVEVKYQGDVIRSYDLDYQEGRFDKNLLEWVSEKDKNGNEFYRHDFEYYDDVTDNDGKLYTAPETIEVPDFGASFTNNFGNALLGKSAISSGESIETGFNAGVSAGVEIRLGSLSQDKRKTITIGAPFGENSYKNKGKISLVDANGDGIDDIIYRTGNGLRYINGQLEINSSDGALKHGFQAGENTIANAYDFSKSKGFSKTIFGESFELYAKLLNVPGNFYAAKKRVKSKSESTIYMTDGNGDGLLDIVRNKVVYFNTIDETTGDPTYTPASHLSENMVLQGAGIGIPTDPDPDPDPDPEIQEALLDFDAVRVWIAPRDGIVKLEDRVKKEGAGIVHYTIETARDGVLGGRPFRIASLTPGTSFSSVNYTKYENGAPLGLAAQGLSYPGLIEVIEGQRIYFRLHSSASNPRVFSTPVVKYTGAVAHDENGLDVNNYYYAKEFYLNNNEGFSFPGTGSATISLPAISIPTRSDEVQIKIDQYIYNSDGELVTQEPISLFDVVLPAGSGGPLNTSSLIQPQPNLDENRTVVITFEVISESNPFAWAIFDWKPTINFTPSGGTGNNEDPISQIVVPDQSIYRASGQTPEYKHELRSNNWSNPPVGTRTFSARPSIISGSPSNFNSEDGGEFTFVVKRNGQFVEKRLITVDNGTISISGGNPVAVELFTGNLGIQNDPDLINFYFGYTAVGPANKALLEKYISATGEDTSTEISYNNFANSFASHKTKTTAFYNDEYPHLGPLYRGWGHFFYNDNYGEYPIGDSIGYLINSNVIDNPQLNNTFNVSNCPQDENYADCVQASIDLPAEGTNIDENNIEEVFDNLEDWMVANNFEFPEISFIPATAKRLNSSSTSRRWIGLGNEQYFKYNMLKTNNLASASGGGGDPDPDGDGGNSGPFSGIIQDDDSDGPWESMDTNTGMQAIEKVQKTSTRTLAAGYGPAIFNNSKTSYSRILSDFIDLNGDSYPDPLFPNQYVRSNMTGGYEAGFKDHNFEYSGTSDSENTALSVSGTTADLRTDKPAPEPIVIRTVFRSGGRSAITTTTPGAPSSRVGINANLAGDNEELSLLADINGDGLMDRVANEGSGYQYYLNKGAFNNTESAPENFNFLIGGITEPATFNINGGFGGNAANFATTFANSDGLSSILYGGLSFSAGISGSRSNTRSTLQDINGDGMADILITDGTQGKVRFNNGTSFGSVRDLDVSGIAFAVPNLNNDNRHRGVSAELQASVYFGFPICCYLIPIVHLKFGATLGGSMSLSISDVQEVFKDMNGDGFADYVHEDGQNLKVYYSAIGRTNKLKTVNNPLGGSFTVDYNAVPKTYDNPNSKWVMKSVTIDDGYDLHNDGEDQYITEFKYEDAKYDRRERAFYGFEKVTVFDYKSNLTTPYRYTTTEYHNKNYFLQGLVKSTYVTKAASFGTSSDEGLFTRSTNFYQIYGLKDDNQKMDLSNALPEDFDIGGTEGRGTAAVVKLKTETELFELTSDPIVSRVTMDYDDLARVVEVNDFGDITDPSHDFKTNITYHSTFGLIQRNLIQIPQNIKVSIGSTVVRERKTQNINQSTGSIGTILSRFDNNSTASFTETNMEYDVYGNLSSIVNPRNANDERMSYEYTYDNVDHKYLIGTSDAFGYSASASFDPAFDTLLSTIDIAGNPMEYTYDDFGRTIRVRGPKEIEAGRPYTIEYNYYTTHDQLQGVANIPASSFMPVGVTDHFDIDHVSDPIRTYTFIDGLAREVQIKKDIRYVLSNQGEKVSISGKTTFDHLGRGIKSYHPWYEVKDTDLNYQVNNYTGVQYFSEILYDELDRPLKTFDEEGNVSTNTYTIENGLHKVTNSMDQSSSQQLESESYSDARGRKVRSIQVGEDGELETSFAYNAINEMTAYTDADNITTFSEYDLLGRKISRIHPDNGTTTHIYDNASNLVSMQTEKMAISGSNVVYNYEFNRLLEVQFPSILGGQNLSDITYQYGAPGSGNQTGRIIRQIDATGIQDFEYGNMGEVVRNVRTIVAPNLPTREFETKFEYDSWNRIQEVTYPDNEKVEYRYDIGGKLYQMLGTVNGSNYSYLRDQRYDYFGQVVYKSFGNLTRGWYYYEPKKRRLRAHLLRDADNKNLLNVSYTYDKASNITKAYNKVTTDNQYQMGGAYTHSYSYDKLNRLQKASGDFKGHQAQDPNDTSRYSLTMSYTNTHGIENKTQSHNRSGNSVATNTYKRDYVYEDGTHQLTKIKNVPGAPFFEMDFLYDPNGNIENVRDTQGNDTDYYWDEINRLRVVDDQTMLQHYIYDAGDERVLKASSDPTQINENGSVVNPSTITFDNYTTYPSNLIVVRPDGEYTKQYFAGTQRVLSRIGEGDVGIFDTFTDGGSEDDQILKNIKQRQIQDVNKITLEGKRASTVDFKPFKSKRDVKGNEVDESQSANFDKKASPPSNGNIYFFHSDHLGTGSYITDASGDAYQFFANLPFGETMVEQQSGTEAYDNRWKFNGKELDTETGLYYYGARYYNPSTSVWLSVDPMADAMPQWNPYNYTMQNPINLIDPDGRMPASSNCEKCKTKYTQETSSDYIFMGVTPQGGVHNLSHVITSKVYEYNDDYSEVNVTTNTTTYNVQLTTGVDEDGNTIFVTDSSTMTTHTQSQKFENSRTIDHGPHRQRIINDVLGDAISDISYGPGSGRNLASSSKVPLGRQHKSIRGYAINLRKDLQENRMFNPYKGKATTNMIITGSSGAVGFAVGLTKWDKRYKWAFGVGILLGNIYRNASDHEGRSSNLGRSKNTSYR